MKKFAEKIPKILGIFYKIFPFFLGIYCYYPIFSADPSQPCPILNAIFSSIMLYSATIEDGMPLTPLLQLARFLAFTATISIILEIFNKLGDLLSYFKLLNRKSTVVYGNSMYADNVYNDLSPLVRIRGKNRMIKHAGRYLIMFSDDRQSLEFYNRNLSYLKGKNVYMMLENTSHRSVENPALTLFSTAENCARVYWEKYGPIVSERIAIVGFGQVGQNILLTGLLMNIISVDQHFEYHIYGDAGRFLKEHTQLDKLQLDDIEFHGIDDYTPDDISAFDRVIICCGENESITVASKIIETTAVCPKIYVYAPNVDIITDLFGMNKLHCFGMASETATADIIFNEKLIESAKRQHAEYVKKHGGVSWENLDGFKRYSNICSADYKVVTDRLIKQGVEMEKLAELEHIRWCRYHYLNNWKYGEKRDDLKRVHNCLVPFSELPEKVRKNDIEAIKSKFVNN